MLTGTGPVERAGATTEHGGTTVRNRTHDGRGRDRDPGARRLHRDHGAPAERGDVPLPHSDGKYDIVYDLELTNAARVPATIERVDVVDAADPATVLASYSGTTLVAPDCPYGDCNRLRRLPSAPATDAGIPAQESRALFVDFTLDSLDEAPKAVLHRLHGAGRSTRAPPSPPPSTTSPHRWTSRPARPGSSGLR